jgi:polyisoprenyl-phosphate glycosyltransferase
MKKVSVVVATYNEEENIKAMCDELLSIFSKQLPQYDYEIIIIDNLSQDNTRKIVEEICATNTIVKAIFNAKNFGQIRSPFYGLLQATGDCVIGMAADFQDPPDLVVKFIGEWEKGAKIVMGKKVKSRESMSMYLFRSMYYKLIKMMSETEQIEHFTGFGLYDRSFIEVLKKLDDPMPYLRGIVAEFGYAKAEVQYIQPIRRAGKTSNNWYRLYDMAMLGLTSYTKVLMRMATITGFLIAGVSFLVAMFYLVMKLIYWERFPFGMAPIIISIFFLGSIQLFFIGFLGEYILNINARVMKRPLVIEEKRINL